MVSRKKSYQSICRNKASTNPSNANYSTMALPTLERTSMGTNRSRGIKSLCYAKSNTGHSKSPRALLRLTITSSTVITCHPCNLLRRQVCHPHRLQVVSSSSSSSIRTISSSHPHHHWGLSHKRYRRRLLLSFARYCYLD